MLRLGVCFIAPSLNTRGGIVLLVAEFKLGDSRVGASATHSFAIKLHQTFFCRSANLARACAVLAANSVGAYEGATSPPPTRG